MTAGRGDFDAPPVPSKLSVRKPVCETAKY